jgi:hypothetical protein
MSNFEAEPLGWRVTRWCFCGIASLTAIFLFHVAAYASWRMGVSGADSERWWALAVRAFGVGLSSGFSAIWGVVNLRAGFNYWREPVSLGLLGLAAVAGLSAWLGSKP